MKDCFDMMNDVESILKVPQLTDVLDGKIWQITMPDFGPLNKKTNICLGTLPMRHRKIAIGTVNIRIYAPPLQSTSNGQIAWLPDQAKYKMLSDIIVPLIDGHYGLDFNTSLADDAALIKDTDGSYFYHIPVEYMHFDSDYNNL